MARGRKKGPSKADMLHESSKKLTAKKFHAFKAEIEVLVADKSHASTNYASKFKECESRGIHPKVLPVIMRLDRMDTITRNAWLHSFDKLRSYMEEWTRQGNLLDSAAEDERREEAEMRDEGEIPTDELPLDDAAEGDAVERGPAEDTVTGPEVERENSLATEPDAGALAGAPEAVEEGRIAGHGGATYDANPRSIDDPLYQAWERGRALGARQSAQGYPLHDEDAAPQPDEVKPKGRSRPRKATESAPAIH